MQRFSIREHNDIMNQINTHTMRSPRLSSSRRANALCCLSSSCCRTSSSSTRTQPSCVRMSLYQCGYFRHRDAYSEQKWFMRLRPCLHRHESLSYCWCRCLWRLLRCCCPRVLQCLLHFRIAQYRRRIFPISDNILLVRMRQSLKCLQPRHPLVPQPVLRQHSPHRPPQDLCTTPFRHQFIHCQLLQTARPRRMSVIFLLKSLLSCCMEIVAPYCYNVVAAVCGWVEDWLVLAHECDGYLGGYATKWSLTGSYVDEMPCSTVGEASLANILGHDQGKAAIRRRDLACF